MQGTCIIIFAHFFPLIFQCHLISYIKILQSSSVADVGLPSIKLKDPPSCFLTEGLTIRLKCSFTLSFEVKPLLNWLYNCFPRTPSHTPWHDTRKPIPQYNLRVATGSQEDHYHVKHSYGKKPTIQYHDNHYGLTEMSFQDEIHCFLQNEFTKVPNGRPDLSLSFGKL